MIPHPSISEMIKTPYGVVSSYTDPDGKTHSGAYASSSLTPDGSWTYYPENVLDGNRSTCWCEGVSGDGIGETLTITTESSHSVSKVVIANGNLSSESSYYANNRIKEFEIIFSDGTSLSATISDSYTTQPFAISFDPKETTSITLRIVSVYSGSSYSDTCVSEFYAE